MTVVPVPVPSLCDWLSSRRGPEGQRWGGRSSRGHGDLAARLAAPRLPLVGRRIPKPFCPCWQRAPRAFASTHRALQGGRLFVSNCSFPGAPSRSLFHHPIKARAWHTLFQAQAIADLRRSKCANSGQD